MSDVSVTPSPATRPRTAQVDIRIDDQEHNMLQVVKLTRNKIRGSKQKLRFEFEVSADEIILVNVMQLNPDPVLALAFATRLGS